MHLGRAIDARVYTTAIHAQVFGSTAPACTRYTRGGEEELCNCRVRRVGSAEWVNTPANQRHVHGRCGHTMHDLLCQPDAEELPDRTGAIIVANAAGEMHVSFVP